MNKNEVFNKLGKVKELSTSPTILKEVLDLVNSPDTSAKDLSELVLKDPGLTTRLLKIANSSYYGFRHEISSVQQAIVMMGLSAVKYFILSLTVLNQLYTQKGKSRLNQKQLWLHFLEVASATKRVALQTGYKYADEAYIAGLLHDIGIVLLENNFPDEYQDVLKLVSKGNTIIEAELEIFGVDHQEVAGNIISHWNIPSILHDPISKHHLNDGEDVNNLSKIGKMVAFVDSMAMVPFDELKNIENAQKRLDTLNILSDELNIEASKLVEIHNNLADEIVSSAAFMELDLGDAVDILSKSNSELFNLYLDTANLFKERQELSRRILRAERMEGTLESLKIAIATLSHYINNATMNIQGKCEILHLFLNKKDIKTLVSNLPSSLESIGKSIKKISLVLDELSNISSMEKINFFHFSKAIDIEKSIKDKLNSQLEEVGVE
ncbi:MAG: hypothetical protein B6D58_05445 [candidate division Zixibacteria bacterium 4484_95]|nr:MAG: hypothetical protein B6D58_05445 [candidate division Zixibacteria bacterium 4484_95]